MQGCYSPLVQAAVSLLLMLGVVSSAQADSEIGTTISGYGTIGGTYTSDGFTYIHNPNESKATNSPFDLGLDSRIGVQAEFTYGTDLSVIVQEEAKRRGRENFSLGTEWAFLQYTPTPDVKLRLGRVALATFLMSDSRDVGYAQPWFRAPNELYTNEPFESLDGAQAHWKVNLGPVGLHLEGAYGTTSQTLQAQTLSIMVSAKSAYNLAATLTYGNFLLRVAETSISFPLTLPLGPAIAVTYTDHDKFLSAGLQYDDGRAIVLSEWAKRTENDIPLVNLPLDISNQWYVAGGWRFGKLTPLLIYGNWSGGLSVLGPATFAATWSASLRYDVVHNLALKAQFSRPPVSVVYFANPNLAVSERVNVFSVGADFVF